MVLSNKRLKQKLRETLAQSLVESVAKPDPKNDGSEKPDPNPQPQSLKVLLDSASQKPRFTKREKRRKLLALRGPEADGSGGKLGENEGEEDKMDVGSEGLGGEKKKKRKRGDEEGKNGNLSEEENGCVKEEGKKPKKKNKKKNKKRKKEGKSGEEKKGGEVGNEEQSVKETNEFIDRQANGDVPTKIYVGGIPYYSTEDDIRSYFENCGTVTEVDCMRFSDSGKFSGIAFISFKTEAAAKRALALDGAEMGEQFLKIQPYKATRAKKESSFAPQIVEGYNRIYVGNLSWDIAEEDLRELFSDCKISSIHFGTNKETGEFRGYAHVNFSDSLSLTMALKLDQKYVLGRPVKISCAVPLKRAGTPSTHSKSAPTTSSTYSISVATSANTIPVATTMDTRAYNSGLSSVSCMMKTRKCYNCGEKGHVCSACPKSAPATLSTHSMSLATTTTNDPISVATTTDTGADNNGLSSVSSKIKRRTCYECGEKGHISSACPKPKCVPTTLSTHSMPVASTTTTDPISPISVAATTDTGADNNGLSSVSGKIKRRTCYECGEKGHISSACPKPKCATTTSSTDSRSLATTKTTYSILVAPTTSTNSIPVAATTGTGADNGGLSAISGRIKGRTCYECGEKGHISSACPKKQSADPVDTNAS